MPKFKTREKFITDSIEIHGNKYGYEFVDYKNSKEWVKIKCLEHEIIFEQTPVGHLSGKEGCRICFSIKKSKSNLKTREKFIMDSIEIHGNKYGYEFVDYKNAKTSIKIKCLIHGIFEQTPDSHLSGSEGCTFCAKIRDTKFSKARALTIEHFILRANTIHSDKYNYEYVNYKNIDTKIKIECPLHGVFEQVPFSHLNGLEGCKKCTNIANSKRQRKDNVFFIEKARNVHNNIYDYNKVIYVDSKTKVDIVCKIHGSFKQKPNSHLSGHGCKNCKESQGEKQISDYFNNKNIEYIRQKRFKDCKNKKPLPFDFYLPNHNMCIEYDGLQHHKIVEYFGGVNGYEGRIKNDNIKNSYCMENNIDLLRISYGSDIIEIIKNKLGLE